MTRPRFTNATPIIVLAAVAIVFAIASGALTIGLIATGRSADAARRAADAGREAKHAVHCTNTSLHVRNDPNVADRRAQDALNDAQDRLNRAQGHLTRAESRDVQILTTSASPESRASAAADLHRAFIAQQHAQAQQHAAYQTYRAIRAHDDRVRAAHPLGKC